DACHPMLPFVAQGAAQAMEDGLTLSSCLQKYDDIAEALARYEALRLPRTAQVQALAANNKIRFHLPDGPEQVARDAKMAAGGTDWSFKAMEWNVRSSVRILGNPLGFGSLARLIERDYPLAARLVANGHHPMRRIKRPRALAQSRKCAAIFRDRGQDPDYVASCRQFI